MGKIYALVLLIVSCTTLNAQEDSTYHIIDGQLLLGTFVVVDSLESDCFDFMDESKITVGKKFVIIDIRDEMENNIGVIIFDKKKGVLNFDTVQTERAKYYKWYKCCVYVQEVNGLLYFWDYIGPDGDYICHDDSQSEGLTYLIPRYYIFDPETGHVETKILANKCSELFQDEKIMCD